MANRSKADDRMLPVPRECGMVIAMRGLRGRGGQDECERGCAEKSNHDLTPLLFLVRGTARFVPCAQSPPVLFGIRQKSYVARIRCFRIGDRFCDAGVGANYSAESAEYTPER